MSQIAMKKESVLWELICFVLLFMPLLFTSLTSIYTVEIPSDIWYKYKIFEFSWVGLFVIIASLFRIRKTKSIRFWLIILIIFAINFFIPTEDNIFKTGNFEMFLIMLEAGAVNCIVFSLDSQIQTNQTAKAESFIQKYFLLCVVTTILRMCLGLSTGGRYGAIGLSVGGTGFFSAIMLLYLIYCKEYSKLGFLSMVGGIVCLVLSGQRTSLFIFVFLCIPYFCKLIIDTSAHKKIGAKRKKMARIIIGGSFLFICACLFLVILLSTTVQIAEFSFIDRTVEAISDFFTGTPSQVDSVEGRQASIEAGLTILTENPLGIPNDFYALQRRMAELQYPTFPHCTILDLMLLWTTPIAIFIFLYCLWLWRILAKHHDGLQWCILFIIIMGVIWGGPFLDSPQLFIELFFITLASIRVKNQYRTRLVLTYNGKKL